MNQAGKDWKPGGNPASRQAKSYLDSSSSSRGGLCLFQRVFMLVSIVQAE